MKRGREDGKIMSPLFPRLHVNDADKGGPRAPPRNKMALYEQLSIPSHRFNLGAASPLPLPTHHCSSVVPSASSSQGCGQERNVFSPFYVPHMPAYATEKISNHSMEGLNPNVVRMGLEIKSSKHVPQRTIDTAGNEPASAVCTMSRSCGLSSGKESPGKKVEDDDDFMVPTFIQPGIPRDSDKDHHLLDRETRCFHSDSPQKNGTTHFKSPIRAQNSDGKTLEQHSSTVLMSQQCERGNNEGKYKEPPMQIMNTENVSHLTTTEKAAKSSNLLKMSSNQVCLNGESSVHNISHCESASLGPEASPRCLNDAEVMEKQDSLDARSGSYSKMSLGNRFRGSCVSENGNEAGGDNTSGMVEDADRNGSSGGSSSGDATKHGSIGDADGNDDASETSMVDSISGVDMSPDDVVGVMGPKHFWKARRAIINQQRVFASQVFQLHRLIKVQKLIASSPSILVEDTSYLRGSTPMTPMKDPPTNSFVKFQHHVGEDKDESCRVSSNSECHKLNMAGIHSLPCEDSNSEGQVSLLQRNMPSSGNLSSVPEILDNKPGSWCIHPPGNQWLIPVMSPTEGLIYKPYVSPCPPTAAFMAPMFGGCSAPIVPPGAGDFVSPSYGVPASHKQQNLDVIPGSPAVASNLFPAPFAMPSLNPLVSNSVVEQVSSLVAPRPTGQNEQQSWISCGMSNPRSEALSECARKKQAAKDSDLQGSTASSPGYRVEQGRDTLSRFPIASASECPGQPPQGHHRDHHSRVIKVVPHNRTSATESAARIFRSIQKERQQYDSI